MLNPGLGLRADYCTQYVKAMRLFQEEPKWLPLNRGPDVDGNPHRKSYLGSVPSPAVAAN